MKLERNSKVHVYQSVKIATPSQEWDLLLFKIDYKPKFYFKKFRKPILLEENWIFGFRQSSGKVPSNPGYITTNVLYPKLYLSTATAVGGNSGSPVLSRWGHVLGIAVRSYAFGDTFFIPAHIIKKHIKETLRRDDAKK